MNIVIILCALAKNGTFGFAYYIIGFKLCSLLLGGIELKDKGLTKAEGVLYGVQLNCVRSADAIGKVR